MKTITLTPAGKAELLIRCLHEPRLQKVIDSPATVISVRVSDGACLIKFKGISGYFSIPKSSYEQ